MPPLSPVRRSWQTRRNEVRRKARWGRRRRAAIAVGLAASLPFAGPAFAQTLPQGGAVVGGTGTIQQTSANQLTINQASQNLAINWNSFSIGSANVVRFVQPSTSAVALNRVLNGDPSQIYGQIQANGQVIIMSPNGIVFGPNSRVDVNALVATTANISTADFMAGKLLFDQASGDANARVVNQGVITVAQGGFAVLAAAGVSNEGRILASGGTVVLGGTKTFAIDFHGDGLLKFAATGTIDQKPAGADALVENAGSIEANGGRVLMTARAARSVLDNVINTTGIVVAKSAQLVNGEIVIDGGDAGIVSVNGTLEASGANAGERGGTVKILGEKVGLFENARVDASGHAGGGTVLVGGNYLGKGPEANAQYLYMDARAVIDASATANGDGGRVILWSDIYTSFQGTILARGGAAGGDGGFVETSSKDNLQVQSGRVDAIAVLGRNGQWLLDPRNVSIVGATAGGTFAGGNPDIFTPTADNATINAATIVSTLDGGTDVTITTGGSGVQAGNITVSAAIAKTAGGNAVLKLLADGDIVINNSITSTVGSLSLLLNARVGGGGTGQILIQPAAAGTLSIATNGGYLVMGGGNALSVTATGGTVSSSTISTSAATGINVLLNGSYDAGISIATAGGDLLMHGAGGSTVATQMGVRIDSTDASGSFPANTIAISTGSGQIYIKGTGGTYGGIENNGVSLRGRSTAAVTIANTSGDFWIEGTGGDYGLSRGVRLRDVTLTTGQIGDTANRRITGTATLNNNPGILFDAVNATININTDGLFEFFGTGSGTGYGIESAGSGHSILAPNGASVRFKSDTLALDSGISVNIGTGGRLVVDPLTAVAAQFNYTGAATQAFLYLSDGFLSSVTTPSLSFGAGSASLTVPSAYALPANASLSLVSGGAITVGNALAATGTGSISLNSATNVAISANVTTATGDILIQGNIASWASPYATNAPVFGTTAGNFKGVTILSNVTSSGGNIAIAGKGGTTGTYDYGVELVGATVSTTGAGTVTIFGQGGPSTSHVYGIGAHIGVNLATSTVSSASAIKLVGTGGGSGTADNNVGMQIFDSAVSATGSGTLVLTGTGGNGGSTGLIVDGSGAIVSVVNGNMTVAGIGGTGDNASGDGFFRSLGFLAQNSATVQTTGTGNINITGTGGAGGGAQGLNKVGVSVLSGSVVLSTGAGDISLTGTGGNGTGNSNLGVTIDGGTVSAGAGGLTIVATGGAGTGTLNHGLYAASSASITGASGGAMSITGTGGAFSGAGLSFNGANIAAAGSTTLTLSGNSTTSYGIEGFGTASSISTANGTLTMNASGDVYLPATSVATAGAAFSATSTGNITLTNAANSFVGGNVAIAAGTSGSVAIAATNATSFGAISAGGNFQATVANAVTFNAPISIANGGAFDVTSTGATAGIVLQGSANVTLTGGGSSSLISDRGITVNTAVATNGGNILLLGNASWAGAPAGTPTFGSASGAFVGVSIDSGAQIDAGGGNIAIAGKGGNDTAGAQHGVHLTAASQISTTGAGTVAIYGQGGASVGVANLGVYLQGGAIVQATNGAVALEGTGGGAGGSFHNIGVSVEGGIVRTTGTGALDVTGTGGLIGNGVIVTVTGGAIRTANGNLTVTGTATDIRTGVELTNYAGNGIIESTGVGNVTVLGTGGSAAGTGAHGINIDGTGQIKSASGTLELNGTGGGTATSSDGIRLANGATVASISGAMTLTGTSSTGFDVSGSGTGWTIGGANTVGSIEINGDTMSLGATGANLQTSGLVAIAPNTPGINIGLGSASGTLQLASLGFVQAGQLYIGSTTAGAINVDGITLANGTDLTLEGASIALTGNVTLGAANLLALRATTSGVTQSAASGISAESLLLYGQGNFTLTRDGSLYNNVEHVAADVTGNLALRTSYSSGQAQAQSETDAIGTVNGVSAANLSWSTAGGFSQSVGANIVVPGTVNLVAGTGTVALENTGNNVGGAVSISAVTNVNFRNSGATLLGNISAGSGSVTVRADAGSLTQNTGATISGGAGDFTASAGVINLFNVGNALSSVALTAGGGGSADFRNSQGFSLGASNVSAGLTVQADAGGITQTGAVTTGGKYDLTAVGAIGVQSATVGGLFRALTSAGAITQSSGSIAFTGTGATYAAATGGVTLNTSGNTNLVGIVSGGVLNLSVTGGNLTQTANIVTSGATTLTVGNAYQMTLTDSSNIFGSTVTLAGQGGAVAGGVSGALLASNAGFTFNGNAVPTTLASTAPVTGGGGTSVSNAISSVAPVEALVSTPAFSAALTQTISAVLSSAVASLTGADAGAVVGGGTTGTPAAGGGGGEATNADGSPAVPVVVSVTGAAPAPAAGGTPAAGGAPGAPTPTIAVSAGGGVTPATAVRTGAGTPIGVSVVFPGLSVNPAPGVTGARAVIRGPIN